MKSKQRNKQKDILFILVSSFIVVAAWIGFNLYHIHVTSTISQFVQVQLNPIDPQFDPQVIQQLKTRKSVNPLFENQASSSAAVPTLAPLGTTPSPAPSVSSKPPQTVSGTPQNAPTNSPIDRQGQ